MNDTSYKNRITKEQSVLMNAAKERKRLERDAYDYPVDNRPELCRALIGISFEGDDPVTWEYDLFRHHGQGRKIDVYSVTENGVLVPRRVGWSRVCQRMIGKFPAVRYVSN